tara:strand:+ start:1446 stop:2162 length:717 start_codon:yes stop_codon:yes gene_type:complete
MTRVYLDKEFKPEDSIQLSKDSSRHLIKVLRKKSGDEIELFDGKGRSCRAILLRPVKDKLPVKIVSDSFFSRRDKIEINIGLSLIKNDPFSIALQKSAELGVKSVTPLITERTQLAKKNIKESKIARWNSILRSACEQCGDNWIPEISEPIDLISWSKTINSKTKLVLYPHSQKKITDVSISDSITIAIGPVGDFSEKEIINLEAKGFMPVSIGKRILRAETAVISSVSCIRTMTGGF